MRILKFIPGLLLFLITLIPSCKPGGALTPDEAFERLRSAYREGDAAAIQDLLSTPSREKIGTVIRGFARMNDVQKKALSSRLGVPPEDLGSMTVKKYLEIQLAVGREHGNDVVMKCTGERIISREKQGNRATLTFATGHQLGFLKEGPYWKLDITDL